MDIKCTVEGQKLRIVSPHPFPQGSDNFDVFLFSLSSDWDGLMVFAQFRQKDNVSNEYLTNVTRTEDGNEVTYPSVTLPNWLQPGPATMTLYGTGREDVIGTTNYVLINVAATGFVGDAITSDLTETLYQQMVNRFIQYEWAYDVVKNYQGAWEALTSAISNGTNWTELPVTSQTTEPSSPSDGDYWYDTTNSLLKKYKASTTSWETITDATADDTTPPDVYYFYDSDAEKLYRTPIAAIPTATASRTGGFKLDAGNFRIGNSSDDPAADVGKLLLKNNVTLKGKLTVETDKPIFYFIKRLTDEDDLDEVLTTGIYFYQQTSAPAHKPSAVSSVVAVFSNQATSKYVLQVAGNTNGLMFYRGFTSNGTASEKPAWNRVATKANVDDLQAISYVKQGALSTSVTSLATVTGFGCYTLNSTNYGVLSDMPSDFGSVSSASILRVEPLGNTGALQRLTHFATGRTWFRNLSDDIPTWVLEVDKTLTISGAPADARTVGNNAFLFRGILPEGTTSLASVTNYGFYGLTEGNYAELTDLPRDMIKSKTATLDVTALSNSTTVQTLTHNPTGRRWSRNVTNGEAARWKLFSEGRRKISVRLMGQSGAATQRLLIYVPDDTGYMIYQLYHYVSLDDDNPGSEDPVKNCDGWQINYIQHTDYKYSQDSIVRLSQAGEWECAVKLEGRGDFSGGHTHGDEIMTSAVLFLDGVPTDIDTDTLPSSADVLYVDEVRFIQNSTLYDPNDGTTPIADHGKEYIFTLNGMRINQSLKWKGAYSLDKCYMAMALPLKQTAVTPPDVPAVVTNRAYADVGMSEIELDEQEGYYTTGYSVTIPNAKRVVMYGEDNGFTLEMNLLEYPTGLPGGDKAVITDNDGKAYNKLYYVICTSGTTTTGELWRSAAEYKMRMTYIPPAAE